MEIQLDKELITRANNQSMFNRGDNTLQMANEYYEDFIKKFDNSSYNEQQKSIYEKRKVVFKEFLEKSLNEYLSISSKFVPITIAGPSNYPTAQQQKISERMGNKAKEITDKIDKFYNNTEKMLNNAYTKEEILEKYRHGYKEPISNDDPLALEKLKAKLEYLENTHQKYKGFNKQARKNKQNPLPPYLLANSKQNINSVKNRIIQIEKMNKLSEDGYLFNGGEVKFDKEDMRVKIFFDEKPNEEMRKELKSHAFKWSPRNLAWQRKLTSNAIYITKRIFTETKDKQLDSPEEKSLTI